MYFYDEPPAERECCECEEKSDSLEEIKNWFTHMLQHLYSKSPLDRDDLETCLEEIAHQCGIRLPEGELQISRRPNDKVVSIQVADELEAWKKWNTEYLQQIMSQI